MNFIELAATELGLGTCWVCNFDAARCCEIFKTPENLEPIVLIPIGYPNSQPDIVKQRKSIDQIVRWNQLGPF